MRFLYTFLCLLGLAGLNAQSAADVSVDADGPTLAYRTADNVQELKGYKLQRRERTLLGDLDLSGAWGGPTYNYSMTGDDWALMRGGFGGLEFGDEFFLGYGGWKAREDFTVDDPADAGEPQYRFRNSGFILAYSPLRNSPIHPRITTIIGPGRIDLDPFTVPDGVDLDDRMLVGQAMIGLELNLFQWFRLGVDGGYRFANGVDVQHNGVDLVTDKDVSGAILQVEARFGFSW
ncbi:MAG: hypothetical protein AAFZ52_08105 [Bacteroidota bacterium]